MKIAATTTSSESNAQNLISNMHIMHSQTVAQILYQEGGIETDKDNIAVMVMSVQEFHGVNQQ
jgi:hypothetical protein